MRAELPYLKISFIRHGLVHNPNQIFYGRLPRMQLSAEGLWQAEAARDHLKDVPLAALFSSPMLRTRQTARILLQAHPGVRLRISRLLHEIYTPFDGWSHSKMDERDWDIYEGITPEFEQPEDIERRVRKFVAGLRRDFAGCHVAAVTHGELCACMILHAGGLNLSRLTHTRIYDLIGENYPKPASITTFTFKTSALDERPDLEHWNPGRKKE